MTDIAALENARYAAMLAGNAGALRAMCSPRLHYSHSQGNRDSRESWLAQIEAGTMVYHAISHSIDWAETLPGTILIGGRMTATVEVNGARRDIDNACLIVWADEGADEDADGGGGADAGSDGGTTWRLIAFQPTPLPR